MEIKCLKTRISFWLHNTRIAKISNINTLTITNGYSNKNKNFWNNYKFVNIDECINILESYMIEKLGSSLTKNEKEIVSTLFYYKYINIVIGGPGTLCTNED